MARKWLGQLYIQVLIGIALGIGVGLAFPDVAIALQPLAEAFIKLIKMLLAPIIFCSVALGIAGMGSVKSAGRLGVKSLIYFEVVSTLALVIGLVVVNLMKPGVGMNINAESMDASSLAKFQPAEPSKGGFDFLLNIIPNTMAEAFVAGSMLQVILVAVLVGTSLASIGERGQQFSDVLSSFLQVMFRIVGMIMRLAPVGAGAGVAFTVGKYGIGTLWGLGHLIVALYVTSALFIVIVLGSIARWAGLPLMQFVRYFKEELLVTFATCSTEAVMPKMMAKLEQLGCEKTVVGLVVPTGYAFNADGTCIYLTMAAIFVAQATNTPLAFADQILILGVLLLTSKGSAGVAGAGFVTLVATLSTVGTIPVAGLVLLLGVDRFLNEARAITNLIGNGVATLAIAKWEGRLDPAALHSAVAATGKAEAVPPASVTLPNTPS